MNGDLPLLHATRAGLRVVRLVSAVREGECQLGARPALVCAVDGGGRERWLTGEEWEAAVEAAKSTAPVALFGPVR